MEKLTVKDLYGMVSDKDLGPKAKINFALGDRHIKPQDIKVYALQASSYDRDDHGTIVVNISAEYVESLVKERMKQLFNEHVESMFTPKAVSP